MIGFGKKSSKQAEECEGNGSSSMKDTRFSLLPFASIKVNRIVGKNKGIFFQGQQDASSKNSIYDETGMRMVNDSDSLRMEARVQFEDEYNDSSYNNKMKYSFGVSSMNEIYKQEQKDPSNIENKIKKHKTLDFKNKDKQQLTNKIESDQNPTSNRSSLNDQFDTRRNPNLIIDIPIALNGHNILSDEYSTGKDHSAVRSRPSPLKGILLSTEKSKFGYRMKRTNKKIQEDIQTSGEKKENGTSSMQSLPHDSKCIPPLDDVLKKSLSQKPFKSYNNVSPRKTTDTTKSREYMEGKMNGIDYNGKIEMDTQYQQPTSKRLMINGMDDEEDGRDRLSEQNERHEIYYNDITDTIKRSKTNQVNPIGNNSTKLGENVLKSRVSFSESNSVRFVKKYIKEFNMDKKGSDTNTNTKHCCHIYCTLI